MKTSGRPPSSKRPGSPKSREGPRRHDPCEHVAGHGGAAQSDASPTTCSSSPISQTHSLPMWLACRSTSRAASCRRRAKACLAAASRWPSAPSLPSRTTRCSLERAMARCSITSTNCALQMEHKLPSCASCSPTARQAREPPADGLPLPEPVVIRDSPTPSRSTYLRRSAPSRAKRSARVPTWRGPCSAPSTRRRPTSSKSRLRSRKVLPATTSGGMGAEASDHGPRDPG